MLLFFLTAAVLFTTAPVPTSYPKYQSVEKVIERAFTSCPEDLIWASGDVNDAQDYLKKIEKLSSRKFELLDIGYTIVVPQSYGSFTLWIELDTIGIKHLTEAWYYHNPSQLEEKYDLMLNTMLDIHGEPVEEDWDYAYWEGLHPSCGDVMILFQFEPKGSFISRRVRFR